MISLEDFGFFQLMLLSFMSITTIVVLLLAIPSKDIEKDIGTKLFRVNYYMQKIIIILIGILILSIFIVTKLFLISGRFISFLISVIMFSVTLIYASANRNYIIKQKRLILTSTIISIISLYLYTLSANIIILENFPKYFYPSALPIIESGNLQTYHQQAITGSSYYFVPVEALLSSAYVLVTGIGISGAGIIRIFFILILILTLYLFYTKELNLLYAIPSIYLIISPGVGFLSTEINRVMSIVLAYLFFYGLISKKLEGYSNYLTLLILFIITLFSHALGSFFAIGITFILIIVYRLNTNSNKSFKFLIKIMTMIIVISLVYWIYTQVIISISAQGIKLENIIISFINRLGTGKIPSDIISYYAPGYSRGGLKIYAIPWASAPSFLLASLIVIFLKKLANEKRNLKYLLYIRNESATEKLILLISLLGLTIFVIAYASYTIGYETGQYLLVLGSMVSFIPAAYIIHEVFKKHSFSRRVIVSVIMSILVFLGACSPTWTPLDDPNFEVSAKVHEAHSYVESSTINKFLNKFQKNIKIYYDYDLSIGGGIYKDVRKVIYSIIYQNQDFSSFSSKPYTLFIINVDRFVSPYISSKIVKNDIVFSSDFHICIVSRPLS